MNTAELKMNLINRIANTEESQIIEELHNLLNFELNNETYKLNSKQSERINEAKAEYLSGKVLTEQQADKAIDQWLKEK